MNVLDLPGISISNFNSSKESLNFRPKVWPPASDSPVVIDKNNKVVSRYGDYRWDFSAWHGSTLKIYFGDGPGKGLKVCSKNAALLRLIMAWWIWGYGAATTATTLVRKFDAIKPIFVVCTQHNILVSELSKHPDIVRKCGERYNSKNSHLISYLNDILFAKEYLGFTILDESSLNILIKNLGNNIKVQTAYIPPRIWSYQVKRLKEFLDEFINHEEKIISFYNFCLNSYITNSKSSESICIRGLGIDSPFSPSRKKGERLSGKIFYGTFESVANKYGLVDILRKWGNAEHGLTLKTFTGYLSLASHVGSAYIANFSLMRISEISRLRADCLEIEIDSYNEKIYLIKGMTFKTLKDADARWIVSPTVRIAIDVMSVVSRLRTKSTQLNPNLNLSKEDIENPLLQAIYWEPWGATIKDRFNNEYKKLRSYAEISKIWNNLFDDQEMTITNDDLNTARRMTNNLDKNTYAVGKIWHIAWHQLRRTGAVNMLASGLVSEFSLQYQLKHANQAMTRYYGQNYYKLSKPLDVNARNFYLKEMYESIVGDFKKLQSDNFISPHSNKRKQQILSEISLKDHNTLLKAAETGKISYRETFLGGCANNGPPCSLGGISNISSCMGYGENKPCKSILLDINKLNLIENLKDSLIHQLGEVKDNSPLSLSLKAQLESLERAIHVINKE